jgi:hypothetical protein
MHEIIIKKIKEKVIEALPTTRSYCGSKSHAMPSNLRSGKGKRSSRHHFSKKKRNIQLGPTAYVEITFA